MSENYKRLYRSRENKIIAGVCGGLGEYFGIDPVIVRIVFVLLLFAGGSGLLIYIILAIIVPEKPHGGKKEEGIDLKENVQKAAHDVKEKITKGSNSKEIIGMIVIVIGFFALANAIAPSFFRWSYLLAIAIIAIGIYLVMGNKNNK